MAEYATLTQDIHCVDALYVKPRVASIYLIREGDEVAVVETGTYYSVENVLASMHELGIERQQVKYVIPTHVHLDHAGGASEMMRRFPQASLIIHPRGAAHMIDPSRLIAATVDVYGQETFDRLYGNIEAIAEQRILVAGDLDRFELNSRELLFFDTPGHARHHFCIFDAKSQGVFTGDTFGVSYDLMKNLRRGLIPTTPPTQFDPPALRASIDRIMQYRPQRLYLTHYGEFSNPAAQVDSFNRWIDDYVALCQDFDADDDDAAQALEKALAELILDKLSANGAGSELARVLKIDIGLNAQGLVFWRRRSSRG